MIANSFSFWSSLISFWILVISPFIEPMQAHAIDKPQQIQPSTTLHVIERLSLGPRPGDIEHVNQMGIEAYIQEQLHPERISEPPELQAQLNQFSTLRQSSIALLKEYLPLLKQLRKLQQDSKASLEGLDDNSSHAKDSPEAKQIKRKLIIPYMEASQARLIRAINSPRQLQEVMTDFWYNHFNVVNQKQLDRFLIGAYEEQAIRPYALGRFRDLLYATAHHPAMLFYLDNWQNTAPNSPGARGQFKGLNENYARELMELHTLGVDGGYTQNDVVVLAKILTGWGLPHAGLRQGMGKRRENGLALAQNLSYGFYFDDSRHDTSNKVFLGRTIQSAGQQEGEIALDMLARHPSTAHHIAYQLAQYFVNDDPPAALVDLLAKQYLATDGHIGKMLNTLFHSQAFLSSQQYGSKYKTPYRYVIETARASGIKVQNVFPLIVTLRQWGMPLYGCLTPDGYKNTAEAWMSPDALANRLNFATVFSRTGLALDQPPPDWTRFDSPQAALKQLLQQQASNAMPISPQMIQKAYGGSFEIKTIQAIQNSAPALEAALLLGSPERMYF